MAGFCCFALILICLKSYFNNAAGESGLEIRPAVEKDGGMDTQRNLKCT